MFKLKHVKGIHQNFISKANSIHEYRWLACELMKSSAFIFASGQHIGMQGLTSNTQILLEAFAFPVKSLCLIPAVLNTDRPRCCTTTPGDASHHRQVASSNLELACTLEFQVCKSPNLGFYISQNLPRCKPPTCSRRLHQQAI